MDDQFKGSILKPPAAPIKAPPLIPDGLKTALLFVLLITVVFLLYDGYKFQQANKAQMAQVAEQIQSLEKAGQAMAATLGSEISQTRQQVGTTDAELKKTTQQTQQIKLEGQKTKTELSQQLATKAAAADVQAVKSEAESKFGQVSSEVGGVKNDVGTVKTDVGTVKADLASTRKDLEGTQRQLVDVKETLTAAVAKNTSELDALRRKGERDYFEFSIPKKGQATKVGDIQLILKSTDVKKGKFTIDILVDDNKIEKKDSNVNEPLAFLVGKNRLRYELVINWVQKDKAAGYLSVPKDKTLSSEKSGGD